MSAASTKARAAERERECRERGGRRNEGGGGARSLSLFFPVRRSSPSPHAGTRPRHPGPARQQAQGGGRNRDRAQGKRSERERGARRGGRGKRREAFYGGRAWERGTPPRARPRPLLTLSPPLPLQARDGAKRVAIAANAIARVADVKLEAYPKSDTVFALLGE